MKIVVKCTNLEEKSLPRLLATTHLRQDHSADVWAISPPGHQYVIKACRMSKRHKFQTFVPKLVHFTTISLILGTMNTIFLTSISISVILCVHQKSKNKHYVDNLKYSHYNF